MNTEELPVEYRGAEKIPSFLENDHAWTWVNSGIVYQVYKPKLITTLEVAKSLVAARKEVSGGKLRPVFVDMRNHRHVERPAMKYYKTEDVIKGLNAGAFLIDNYLSRLAINIFIDLKKPLIPTKFFTNRERALEWLETFKFMS